MVNDALNNLDRCDCDDGLAGYRFYKEIAHGLFCKGRNEAYRRGIYHGCLAGMVCDFSPTGGRISRIVLAFQT